MEITKYIDYLNSQSDIIAYRHTKDLGGNDYFMVVVETKCANGTVIYYLYSIYNVYGNEFCRDLRGFCSYKTKALAVEAVERICGGNNITIIK